MKGEKILQPLFLIFFVGLVACNGAVQDNKRFVVAQDPLKYDSPAIKMPGLLDSIRNRKELSPVQLLTLKVDSIFFTPQSYFYGDGLIRLSDSLAVIILEHSDGLVCTNKLLVTFNTKRMTGIEHKLVHTDCDMDASSNNIQLNYAFVNDSVFWIEERVYSIGDADLERPEVTKTRWHVLNDGRIVVL